MSVYLHVFIVILLFIYRCINLFSPLMILFTFLSILLEISNYARGVKIHSLKSGHDSQCRFTERCVLLIFAQSLIEEEIQITFAGLQFISVNPLFFWKESCQGYCLEVFFVYKSPELYINHGI